MEAVEKLREERSFSVDRYNLLKEDETVTVCTSDPRSVEQDILAEPHKKRQ